MFESGKFGSLKEIAKLEAKISIIDQAMFEPAKAAPEVRDMSMGDLSHQRGKLSALIEEKEAEWLALSETIEVAG